MKQILCISLILCICCGCSLPRFTFDTPNTVAQSVEKEKAKEICKGNAAWDELGNIKTCSKGYYRYAELYNKAERNMTLVERVRSFFNKIFGWGIPGLIIICVLFPGAFTIIGTILGRLFEGAYGVARQTLNKVARAVQQTRKNGADLNTALDTSLDQKHKDYIKKVKTQEKIV